MKPRVLFVDDDRSNLAVFAAACDERLEPLCAIDAEQALAVLREVEVAVVIADQRMPGKTGVELLETITREYPETIRFLITAYSDLSVTVDAINRGQVHRYLKKPWEPRELYAGLLEAADLYQMTRKLRALERRLLETERVYALGVVAAGIAAELEQPIASLRTGIERARGCLAAALRHLPERHASGKAGATLRELEESLVDAVTGVERVTEVMRGLQPAAGEPLDAVADLLEVVELALRIVRHDIKKVAALELDLRPVPAVRGAGTKLGQVVLNLLVNAVQALDGLGQRRTIRVALSATDTTATLEIADDGPGIREDDLERIFDPFFTTKHAGGSGLGLAISRAIVEEQGGRIEAENRAGGGALFRLVLPLAEPPAAA